MERKQCLHPALPGNPFLATSAAFYKDLAAEGNSEVLMLEQNNPNPFNEKTTINCFIPAYSIDARILVFDMQGTLVKTTVLSGRNQTEITFSGAELKAGMYIYSLVVDGKEIDSKRMILTE